MAGVIALFASLFTWQALGPLSCLLIGLYSTWVFGTLFYCLRLIKNHIRVPNFFINIVAQSFLFAMTVGCGTALMAVGIIAVATARTPSHEFAKAMAPFLYWQNIGAIVLVGTMISGIINGFFEIDRKMGPGVIWNWVTGKYYNPREEERIFMFLDLKDSTTLAEQLGNLRFSSLVRDFFKDLTGPVLATRGEVSHYIGDEAVLTWKPEVGVKDAACLQLFFLFQQVLASREGYYSATYGVLPKFKAGAHIGKVVATEVGEVKSEIVFHGDVLNTSARIQGLCNQLGEPLLISRELAGKLETQVDLEMRSLGEHVLKGKGSAVEIFAVRQISQKT